MWYQPDQPCPRCSSQRPDNRSQRKFRLREVNRRQRLKNPNSALKLHSDARGEDAHDLMNDNRRDISSDLESETRNFSRTEVGPENHTADCKNGWSLPSSSATTHSGRTTSLNFRRISSVGSSDIGISVWKGHFASQRLAIKQHELSRKSGSPHRSNRRCPAEPRKLLRILVNQATPRAVQWERTCGSPDAQPDLPNRILSVDFLSSLAAASRQRTLRELRPDRDRISKPLLANG